MPADPFTFDAAPSHAIRRAVLTVARPFLSWVLGLDALRAAYAQVRMAGGDPFDTLVLQVLGVAVNWDARDIERIPRSGPLVVAANHPLGAIDGLALMSALRQARPDVRLLANGLLARIPELRAVCFFVDPFDGPAAAARSTAGLRAAQRWLRQGGALIVFPAGEVAPRYVNGAPVDAPWRPTVGRLAAETGANVVPAHVSGSNSRLFYNAGRLHPRLRTVMLPRELLKQRGQSVHVRFGAALTADVTQALSADNGTALTGAIRMGVERLRSSVQGPGAPVADEVESLGRTALLTANGPFDVYCVEAERIPQTLREIGRLRAIAYRASGEGSGAEIDTDTFDRSYLHLFAWDRQARIVVGAYRLARTDRLVAEGGVGALYTRTLFQYGPEFVERLTPGLELGRSFVRPEYQRHPMALLALWKGIGAYVVRHPQYRFLFGPVSISARHSDAARSLMASFLEQHHLDTASSALVKPFHPWLEGRRGARDGAVPASVDEANRLVASLDAGSNGMPVLLRQYLRLGARLIGLSTDPLFGNVLDALMVVDLARVPPALLARYFGREGAAALRARYAVELRAGVAA
jgi:putative hemolysin